MRELANVNYQKELEKLIEQHEKEGKVPRLFLHALLCALQQFMSWNYSFQFFLLQYFFIIPNISPKEEYEKRVAEIRRLISEMEFLHPVDLVEGAYRQRILCMAKAGGCTGGRRTVFQMLSASNGGSSKAGSGGRI